MRILQIFSQNEWSYSNSHNTYFFKDHSEIHHSIEIKNIQSKETKIVRLKDHAITLTADHITTKKIDPVITFGIETTTIQTDRETILSHHIDTTLNNQVHKVKITEVVYQNIKDKLVEYNQQKKPIQTLPVLTTQKTRIYS